MKYPEQKPGPCLQKLIENGDAYINDPINNALYVYGIASDGVTMLLGSNQDYDEIENYLKEYPTPEDW